MGAPGAIQVTRPYLSLTGPKLCVTISLAYAAIGMTEVVCADLDFTALVGEVPAARRKSQLPEYGICLLTHPFRNKG